MPSGAEVENVELMKSGEGNGTVYRVKVLSGQKSIWLAPVYIQLGEEPTCLTAHYKEDRPA